MNMSYNKENKNNTREAVRDEDTQNDDTKIDVKMKNPNVVNAKKSYSWLNKGDVSNYVTFIITIIGLIYRHYDRSSIVARYILAFGLFGFAGGITNWLAIKMLFDRIPGLIGSGVIPRQFKEIRQTVKDTIMVAFFDQEFLKSYLKDRSQTLLQQINLHAQIEAVLNDPNIDTVLSTKMTEISFKPEGALVAMIIPMFGGVEEMISAIKPMLIVFGKEMSKMLTEKFDPLHYISIEKIRHEIDHLMSEKLTLLTPEMVKSLMESVIRNHLGWLVVWGNVFGALIGIISELSGYGKN